MKTPFLLRSLFAVAVVAVFVWSMFPMTQTDFYDTFRSISKDADDPELVALIDDAKEKQKADIKEYPYPSKAIDAAANDKGGVELKKFLPENVIKNSKIKTNADVISMIRKRSAGALHLGIDLNGGAEFMLELTPVGEDAEKDFEKFRDNAIETIRKRLEAQNYLECEIAPAGGKLISVRVPTISDDEKAKLEQLILRSAKLEFRLAYPDYNELGRILNDIDVAHEAYNAENPGKLLTKEKFYTEVYRPAHANLADYDLLYTLEDNGKRNYDLISTKVEMTGSGVKNAMVGYTQFGQREIQLEFNGEGANQFGKITTANVGKRLGIVLDGQLYSAPNLNEPILGGRAQITGNFSEDEAKGVADALVSGSMPFDITVVSRADIDPTVGSDTIQKSIWSGIIGTILVMIFMIIYYRLAGMIANISLVVNAFVMLGAIAAFDVTLTLPGIAGIVLTIGMAVDANVLIYERIREELNNGKSLANAVNIGFSNAFSAIFDSNMTTLFVALILFWQGSGAIKSFAITLAIGIFTTLFTAVFLTRLLFDLLLKICGNRLKTLSMMQFCKNPKINFLGMKKIYESGEIGKVFNIDSRIHGSRGIPSDWRG
ncbi:MAG: protein translocase subunit SecD, partial [Lentisphaeria bacterium]|nr:protein translocase subunit SecD [Lentisphaeria bacterium]